MIAAKLFVICLALFRFWLQPPLGLFEGLFSGKPSGLEGAGGPGDNVPLAGDLYYKGYGDVGTVGQSLLQFFVLVPVLVCYAGCVSVHEWPSIVG